MLPVPIGTTAMIFKWRREVLEVAAPLCRCPSQQTQCQRRPAPQAPPASSSAACAARAAPAVPPHPLTCHIQDKAEAKCVVSCPDSPSSLVDWSIVVFHRPLHSQTPASCRPQPALSSALGDSGAPPQQPCKATFNSLPTQFALTFPGLNPASNPGVAPPRPTPARTLCRERGCGSGGVPAAVARFPARRRHPVL